jgi:hypothetical protein
MRWHLVVAGVGVAIIAIFGVLRYLSAGPAPPGWLAPSSSIVELQCNSPRGSGVATAPRARFTLSNPGGSPVAVTAVESSCGCATAVVRPPVLPSFSNGTLEVDVTPFAYGERIVWILVRSDSAATPEVRLRVKVIGSRRPPMLLSASGELVFREYSAGETADPYSQVGTCTTLTVCR